MGPLSACAAREILTPVVKLGAREGCNISATGTRTRVARVRAEYPNQLDYSGSGQAVSTQNLTQRRFSGRPPQYGCTALAKTWCSPKTPASTTVRSSISGLVVEYIVAIDVTRVRFPADALFPYRFYAPVSNLNLRWAPRCTTTNGGL